MAAEPTGRTWSVALPVSVPLLNANHRTHWATKANGTAEWRTITHRHAKARDVPSMERARITVTVSWPDKRRRDVHNVMPTIKACVDGLVDAGLLPDDDDAHLIGPDLRRGYGPLGILIEVEELE